jgi:Domain of unknown function (DUF4326)
VAPTRVVNVKLGEPYEVYIGRRMLYRGQHLPASTWANPFKITAAVSREESLRRYRAWLLGRPELVARLGELRGKTLACWCAPRGGLGAADPLVCHGQVLAALADQDD